MLDRTTVVAEQLLGGPVLPTRAKAIRYFGSTPWHVDSVQSMVSIGFMTYLEPLDAENGALRVLPGSHLPKRGNLLRAMGATGRPATELQSEILPTEPGDMIVFDEHLSSYGPDWRTSGRPAVERLETLGVYELAAMHETFARLIYQASRRP